MASVIVAGQSQRQLPLRIAPDGGRLVVGGVLLFGETAFGGALAIAGATELDDGGVMDEPVDGRGGHGRVGEDLVEGGERLVCRDGDAAALVAVGNEFEQHASFRLVLADIGEVVEAEQVVFVELVEGRGQGQVAAGDLELLHHVGGAGEEDAPAGIDEGVAKGGQQMALAGATATEQQQVGAGVEPFMAIGEAEDLRLFDPLGSGEVEGREGLAGGQRGFRQVALDAPGGAVGHLDLEQGGEQLGGRPSLPVGGLGQAPPVASDTRQAQRGQ